MISHAWLALLPIQVMLSKALDFLRKSWKETKIAWQITHRTVICSEMNSWLGLPALFLHLCQEWDLNMWRHSWGGGGASGVRRQTHQLIPRLMPTGKGVNSPHPFNYSVTPPGVLTSWLGFCNVCVHKITLFKSKNCLNTTLVIFK